MFQVEVVWVVTSFSVGGRYQRFGGPCCLHLQGGTLVSYHKSIWRHNAEDLDLIRTWRFKKNAFEKMYVGILYQNTPSHLWLCLA
jgi:hypothetical protein